MFKLKIKHSRKRGRQKRKQFPKIIFWTYKNIFVRRGKSQRRRLQLNWITWRTILFVLASSGSSPGRTSFSLSLSFSGYLSLSLALYHTHTFPISGYLFPPSLSLSLSCTSCRRLKLKTMKVGDEIVSKSSKKVKQLMNRIAFFKMGQPRPLFCLFSVF